MKVRKSSRFTNCTAFEQITSAIRETTRKGLPTEVIRRGKALHIGFIGRERLWYRQTCELAILYPTYHISMVVDGADETKFSHPHSTTSVKHQCGHGIVVHLSGLLRHEAFNKLRLFYMTDAHASGANHIIELIRRFINEIEENEDVIPPHLLLQLYHCWTENKNRYLMAYL